MTGSEQNSLNLKVCWAKTSNHGASNRLHGALLWTIQYNNRLTNNRNSKMFYQNSPISFKFVQRYCSFASLTQHKITHLTIVSIVSVLVRCFRFIVVCFRFIWCKLSNYSKLFSNIMNLIKSFQFLAIPGCPLLVTN